MLDNSRPEIRAAVKVLMIILSGIAMGLLLVLGSEVFGFATIGSIIVVAVLVYLIYIAYSIALSQEQYRDGLKNLKDTVRGE